MIVALCVVSSGALVGILGNLVIGPAMARQELESSQVSFTLLDMIAPIDGGFSVAAEIRISNVKPFSGEIGDADLDVLYMDEVLGKMHAPKLAVDTGKDNYRSISAQPFLINNIALWDKFAYSMVHDKEVSWRLKGVVSLSTTILGMTLKFQGMPFDKSIPLSCFNGMDDVQMSVFDLSQSTAEHLVVNMTVCMKNPSAIAIQQLGDLFFGVYYMGAYMGKDRKSVV